MSQAKADQTKIFFKILRGDLEFGNASKISSAKIQRLFDNPATSAFMTEFINTLTKSNVLTEDQIAKYNNLLEQGKTKTGTDLQRSIQKMQAQNSELVTRQSELDCEIEKAKLKKHRLEIELKRMKELKDKQHRELDKVNGLALDSSNVLKEKRNETEASNEQLWKTISILPVVYRDLCNIIENTDCSCHILSQSDLSNLLKAEESYNAQLTSFVKKQFFEISETIASDLSEREGSNRLCSVSDSSLLFGESEITRQEIAADIKRAELCYPDREKKFISAQALESSAEAALSFLQEKRSKILSSSSDISESSIRQSMEVTVKKVGEVQRELNQLSRSTIPDLISQGRPLQATHLLTGDYHRKLVRQQYFIEKQQKVVSLLELQHKRFNLLWILLQAEEASHVQTGKKIPLLLNHLSTSLEEIISETKWLESNKEEYSSTKSSIFHASDQVALDTAKILEHNKNVSPTSASYVTHDSLHQTSEALQIALDTLWKNSTASPNPDEAQINKLSSGVRECESLLLSGDIDGKGDFDQVMLMPESLRKMKSHLQKESDRLSSALLHSSKEMEKKKHLLQYDEKIATARTAWIDFFMNSHS